MSPTPVVSELLAAAVVVVVGVVAADLAPGQLTASGQSHGTVEVEVEEVVKGRLAVGTGDRVVVPVTVQREIGLWSARTARPGVRLVAFCDGTSTDLRALLTSEHCMRLALADSALDDVHLARSVQRRSPTADRLLHEAEQRRATAGGVFARYLWVAAREALRTSADRFDRLMRVAEDRGTRVEAQEAYLVSAYEDLTFTGEFPDTHRARLARAMLRSALDPRLGELRGILLGTYLPNVLTAPLPAPLVPDDVFAAGPDLPAGADGAALRDQLRAELDDRRDPATTSPALVAWLDALPAVLSSPIDGEG